MIDQDRDEFRKAFFQAGEQVPALVIEIGNRVVGLPKLRHSLPLRMGVKAIADGAAQLHADPGSWMRIVDIDPENERPRQADNADEPQRRCHAHPRDGPKVGNDFGDPALPQTPRQRLANITLLGSENQLQRGNQSEKGRPLMAHFMDQGRCDAAADHPLTRDADHGDRILAAAWQTGPRAPYCAADASIQIADHGRGFVVLRQRQGVRRDDIETGQPDALFVLRCAG